LPDQKTYYQIPTSQLPPNFHPQAPPEQDDVERTTAPTKRPHVKPFRKPVLRFEVRDLSNKTAQSFLTLINAGTALEASVQHVLDLLYTPKTAALIPPTRSVTLILRDMPGVAYTTGTDLDDDHKEIHLSTGFLSQVDESRRAHEIQGVLVHEMVHCWQWAAKGTAPGGLIEGIADWVRLKAGFAPPHWRRAWKDCQWDAGYERTGYFLDWLEEEYGEGTVRKINGAMRDLDYDEVRFWEECCGHKIDKLWTRYGECMEKKKKKGDLSPAAPIPTCS
jgi:hypothetical protein